VDDFMQRLSRLESQMEALEDHLGRITEISRRSYEQTPRMAAELLQRRREGSYRAAYEPDPLVTVRIGAHRPGDLIFDRALRSVTRQSYHNWEVVIVCDGPEPETAARVASIGDRRIRCVQRPRNGPYPESAAERWRVAGTHPFNEAFALARGAWIAPIDQDDEWTDDHLQVLVATARQTGAELVYGVAKAIIAGEGDTYFGAWPPAEGDFGFQAAIYHAGLTMFTYDVNAHLSEEPADWNLARRMLEAGVRFEFLQRVVATYYVSGDSPGIGWWRERLRTRGSFSPPTERRP
jgi:glycosyltransferase involved in cell wall biosynthesis